MGVDARNILNHQTNDADHRTFAQGIHDMLIAAGATQTADTGQANLATIARPAANGVSGYEIFRMNDAEHATLGVYIKCEYGSGNASTIPGIRITVSTGTNGAGVLSPGTLATGILSSPMQWANAADTVGLTRPAFASINNGHFIFAWGLDYITPRGAVVCVERPKLSDGSRTTDGFIFWGKMGHAAAGQAYMGQTMRAAGGGVAGSYQTTRNMPWVSDLDWQDDVVGAEVALFPIPFALAGNMRFSAGLTFRTSAIGSEAVQAVTIFGVSRNYRTLTGFFAESDTSVALPYY